MIKKNLIVSAAVAAALAATAVTLLRAAPAAPPATSQTTAQTTPQKTAQMTAKGYVVAEMTITDPDLFKKYAAAAAPVIAQMGGKYLVRGGQTVGVEGEPPGERFVVIEFESLAAARAFEDSAAYRAVAPMRIKSAHSRILLLEGTPPT